MLRLIDALAEKSKCGTEKIVTRSRSQVGSSPVMVGIEFVFRDKQTYPVS